MINFGSYLVASSYSAFFPALNVAYSVCTLNGESVPCNPQLFAGLFAFLGFVWIFMFAVMFFMIVSFWKIYTKSGRPGWAVIVPFYNIVVLLEIIKKPTWWVLLLFVPLVNIVIGFIALQKLAEAFGKGTGFFLGLLFFPFIFFPILAFGKSTYVFGNTTGETPLPQAAL